MRRRLLLWISSRLFCLIKSIPEGPLTFAGKMADMQAVLLGKISVIAALLAVPGVLFAQSIEVAPKAVKLVQVEGGPLALAKVTIRSSGANVQNWTATATPGDPNDPWIRLEAATGATPAVLTVGVVDWRAESKKPGKFQASILIQSGSAKVTLPVEWEVRAANPLRHSAISRGRPDVSRRRATRIRRFAHRCLFPVYSGRPRLEPVM
jgi:hypothetical protein